MSVHNGRRQRQLLPVGMAFKQLDNLTVKKRYMSFEEVSLLSLGGIVVGTILATVGIIYKQTVLIIIGFLEMALIVLWMIVYFYYS
jgi:uncharacterized membrane protein|tara:strand:- start:5325 stop:5582 length:258 start_codon:yes stop_codon:yes gene_type:complete